MNLKTIVILAAALTGGCVATTFQGLKAEQQGCHTLLRVETAHAAQQSAVVKPPTIVGLELTCHQIDTQVVARNDRAERIKRAADREADRKTWEVWRLSKRLMERAKRADYEQFVLPDDVPWVREFAPNGEGTSIQATDAEIFHPPTFVVYIDTKHRVRIIDWQPMRV